MNVASVVLSPHETVTFHGSSSPGSVNDPRLNAFDVPSSAVWFSAAVTTGATLLMA